MSEIILVPGPSNRFVFTKTELKLEPRERPHRRASTVKGSPSGTRQRPQRQPKSTPVIAAPDTGWPPPKVLTFHVNRAALKEAKSYNSWGELLSAVQSNFSGHLAADGLLYARITTTDAFDWDRAKKALGELGEKRLVVEYKDVAPGQSRRRAHG